MGINVVFDCYLYHSPVSGNAVFLFAFYLTVAMLSLSELILLLTVAVVILQ